MHTFNGYYDGSTPLELILSTNVLYGTAGNRGRFNWGTVFKINTDGTGFTNLYNFTGGSDGGGPTPGLALSSDTLYGTTYYHGASWGTIFSLKTDGTDFSNPYVFQGGSDGNEPYAGVILSNNTLYGTAVYGGNWNRGTVFKINADGFTTLHSFNLASSDGIYPQVRLLLSGDTLFGTTYRGGASAFYGTIFKIKTDGTGFGVLYSLTGGNDGANPYASLILSNNTLLGTTFYGGVSNLGVIFKINTDGTGFTNLHSFTGGADGANPQAALILSGNTLYGTTSAGGLFNAGTVFEVNTDGANYTNLYTFTGSSDGSSPLAGLVLNTNVLYGTASSKGGASSSGTLFALTLPTSSPIPLKFAITGSKLILTWSDPGFALQTTPSLTKVWTNVVGAMSPYTNDTLSAQKFFRLIR